MNPEKLFRTPIRIKNYPFSISHTHKISLIGSCFTENIGYRLAALKFKTDINPFGILYNPLSILKGLERLLNPEKYTLNDLITRDGRWHSFMHHSRFSETDAEKTLININCRLAESAEFIKTTNCIIITFGTAKVYKTLQTNEIVANCHKLPGSFFISEMLDGETLVTAFSEFIIRLKTVNPQVKIILTVSPVRHLRDGIIENSLSKSILISVVHRLVESHENVFYFPAYEIMLDDLRDYRFYEQDMIHPNNTAVEYIFDKFSETYFSLETQKLNDEISKIMKLLQHKPFNTKTKEYQDFLTQTILKISNIQSLYPDIDLSTELNDQKNITK